MKIRSLRLIIVLLALLILLFPIPRTYKDGGTKTFISLTYKVICWKRIINANESKRGTEIHLLPNNFHSLDYYLTKENKDQSK